MDSGPAPLGASRNDDDTARPSTLAAQIRPSCTATFSPHKSEGAGNAGRPLRPLMSRF